MHRPFAAVAVVVTLGLSVSVLSSTTSSATTDDRGRPENLAARQLVPSAAERALERASAALEGTASTPQESVTLALRDLSLALPDLDPAERKRAHALLARPTQGAGDPNGDGYTVRSKRTCSRRICVHYVSRTSDAPPSQKWVDHTLAVMKRTWAHEVGRLGYRRPVPDGSRGGDSRLDVYLKNVGDDGLYGYCAPERSGPEWTASGYCVLDNDFARAEFGVPPDDSLRVAAAHEFFHAIQFAYDYAEDGWLMEATATWVEERVVDDVNDNRQYLPRGQVGRPGEPLDLDQGMNGFNQYGNWAFFEYLSTRFGEDIVRRIWNNADGGYRNHSVKAVRESLPRRQSFAGVFRAYAAANTVPAHSYPEGASWPSAPMAATRALSSGSRTASGAVSVDHLAARHVSLRPDDTLRSRAWRVRVSVNGPGRRTSPTAYVIVHRRGGGLERAAIRLDLDGEGDRTLRFSTRSVRKVTVTLANASTRSRCWQQQLTYACQGIPRDDGLRFAWAATAFRR